MSGKLQEVLDRLQKANNTITEQRKEIVRLRALALKRITKEWQYLTDDEIKQIIGGYGNEGGINGYTRQLFDRIEAKMREKNE
jgi:hypothetical protein